VVASLAAATLIPSTALAASVPGQPTGVMADVGVQGSTVTWTPPASDGGSPITSYTIASSAGPTLTVQAPATSATITGLAAVSQTFTVAATNAVGTGLASVPSSPVTPVNPNPGAPGAPTGITASVSNNVVTINWTPPASSGTSPIVQYDIFSSQGLVLIVPAPATSTTWSNLPMTLQTFQLNAVNASGEGPDSASSNPVTPLGPAAGAPGAPTGVTATAGVGSALVTWTAPANTGTSAITSYEVLSSGGVRTTVGGTATSAVLTGLGTRPHTFSVDAVNSSGPGPNGVSNVVSPQAGGTFHSLTPTRILDTRDGTGGVPVQRIGPGGVLTVQVAGVGGVPMTGVSAVVLNATVTNTDASSFLTIWPTGGVRPTVSNLNWTPGLTVPNLVTVALGFGGRLSIFNHSGDTDVIFDVAGWVGNSTNSTGREGLFNPVRPARLLDTRNGAGPLGPGETRALTVTGAGGVPATGVSSVVLNVTVTNPTNSSFLTVWPAGATRPLASNLNFTPGVTVPNRVIVQVGTGGQVDLFNPFGTVDVVVDVNGWFTDSTNTSGGSGLAAIFPFRILDTRDGTGGVPVQPIGPGGEVTQAFGIQAPISALVLNVTATDATSASFLTVFPDDLATPPLASDLNFVAGQTVPNLTLVKVGATDRGYTVFNQQGSVDVVVDFDAFFSLPVVPLTMTAPGAATAAGRQTSEPSAFASTMPGALGLTPETTARS